MSGSSRAFDRQPLKLVAGETTPGGHGGGTGSRSAFSSRPEIESNAGISSDIERTSMVIEEPIWEWEQLNWFWHSP